MTADTMQTSPAGIALIKHFEGFSATPYQCPAGYWTIGYGHVLKSGQCPLVSGKKASSSFRQETECVSITETQAEELLLQDISYIEGSVKRLLPVPLTQGQFDALVSFTYNLGPGALQRSTLRQKVLRLDHSSAVLELSKWVYAGGQKLPGLVKRRRAEAKLYLIDNK